MNKNTLILTTLLFVGAPLSAQTTESSGFQPLFPETGNWFDINDPGTGFTIEVQNGIISGVYFGFEGGGDSAWLTFAGQLQRGEEGSGIDWFIDTDLFESNNGECITNCAGNAPSDSANVQNLVVSDIRVEFDSVGTASFSVAGNEFVPIQPFTFGVTAEAVFPDFPDFQLPNLTGDWFLRVQIIDAMTDQIDPLESVDQGMVVSFGARQERTDANGQQVFSFPISRTLANVDGLLLDPLSSAGTASPLEVIGELSCSSGVLAECAVNFCNDFSDGFCQPGETGFTTSPLTALNDRRVSSMVSMTIFAGPDTSSFQRSIDLIRLDYD